MFAVIIQLFMGYRKDILSFCGEKSSGGESIMMNKREIPYIDPLTPFDRSILAADPLGSYTGIPINPGEQPVQDADDL